MKDVLSKFGDTVRKRRVEVGLSQDQLAKVADMDRSYVGRIDRGEVNISLEKLYQLAEALQCHPRDLLPD